MNIIENLLFENGFINNNQNINNKCKTQNCDGNIIDIDNQNICDLCGLFNFYHPNTSSKDDYKFKQIHYKRINHLVELLNQLQGTERARIPEDILISVKTHMNKKRNKDINSNTIRNFLKQTDNKKYMDHSRYMLNRLFNKSEFRISRNQEAIIKKMFMDIQKPFDMANKSNRKNFLNYSFIISKICKILKIKNNIFKGFKNKNVLNEHNQIWIMICQILNWEVK